jgi:UDPglucose 6-dehydrogenase
VFRKSSVYGYQRQFSEGKYMSRISIIGSGRVGFNIGNGFDQLGHQVIFNDTDKKIVVGLTELGYRATVDLEFVVSQSEITFICVPTSSKCGGLSNVISLMKNLARVLKEKQDYHLIVIKSTVVPATTEQILIPLMLDSGRKLGDEIGICVNPDFGTEIADTWTKEPEFQRNFFSQDRIVIGQYDTRSGNALEQLYQPLLKPVFKVNLRTAEMIKCVANCLLATKISFWNEIFLICQNLAVDSQQVADIVTIDPRIGRYGAVHGKAFGGKCLPNDLKAFINCSQQHQSPVLLEAVDRINGYMANNYGVRE